MWCIKDHKFPWYLGLPNQKFLKHNIKWVLLRLVLFLEKQREGAEGKNNKWVLVLHHGTARQHGVSATAAASFSSDEQGCSGGGDTQGGSKAPFLELMQQKPKFSTSSLVCTLRWPTKDQKQSALQREIRTLLIAFSSLLLSGDDRPQNLHSGSTEMYQNLRGFLLVKSIKRVWSPACE
ncbi:hypothetical protein MRB53_023062 [Persea americana]|uniref:Uncharacterized protein n=1 Tax=Persea americana TaxID=3435 RepID=A0ACC2L8C9_PERAE|nr:hypothetical protein MRB53_023062 [Persea americana]